MGPVGDNPGRQETVITAGAGSSLGVWSLAAIQHRKANRFMGAWNRQFPQLSEQRGRPSDLDKFHFAGDDLPVQLAAQ